MRKTNSHSPVIFEYLRRYQEDPTSRVFAPLAEAYRKAGLIDEAIQIALEGLQIHPNFIGGRVALARAYFDKKLYQKVIDELQNVVSDAPDNLVAQRLLAESFLILGRVAEALGAYKMLLYFSPADRETAKIVRELEEQAYQKGTLVIQNDTSVDEYEIKPLERVVGENPDLIKRRWREKVQRLQDMLMNIERHRGV